MATPTGRIAGRTLELISFVALGIFWSGQQLQLNHVSHGDRNLAWHHIEQQLTLASLRARTMYTSEAVWLKTADGLRLAGMPE
jgi:hypothetical protein